MRLANIKIRPWYAMDSKYQATATLLPGKNSLVTNGFGVLNYGRFTQRQKFPGTQTDCTLRLFYLCSKETCAMTEFKGVPQSHLVCSGRK